MASSSTNGNGAPEPRRRLRDRILGKGNGRSHSASPARVANNTALGSSPVAQHLVPSQHGNVQVTLRPATQGVPSNDTSHTSSDTVAGDVEIGGPNVVKPAETHAPTITEQVLRPIREVWDEAYEALRADDEDLITKYEAKLGENVDGVDAGAVGRTEKQVLMKTVVDQKLEQYQADLWKVKALGDDFLLKDMAKPLVGVIKWADKYVGDALKSNPMASIGWAGVMVFIPLLLNPSEQQKALLEGLASVSDVLVRSTMQENLYFRRWEANADKNDRAEFVSSHKGYRDTLKALYIQVLKYQATSVCYFTKNGALQVLADVVKWHAWEDMLKDLKGRDEEMCRTYNLLNDVKIEVEFDKLEKRHAEMVDIFKSGFSNVAALREAIVTARRDRKRIELLDWLSLVDPSLNYNNARGKHENGGQGTGDWLMRDNDDFSRWKVAPNSLMWLNGKAGSGKSVLSSSVISHLKEIHRGEPQVALAYYYFSFNDEQKQTANGMIESIIKQICCCRPDTPASMKDLEDLKVRGQRADAGLLQRVLIETLRGFSSVYVVIDALDECPQSEPEHGRKALLTCLTAINYGLSNNMHMLWTSRREKDIETSYQALQSRSEKWDIDLSRYKPAVDHDIGLFIDTTLSSLEYSSWPKNLKDEAREALIERADGMFQYISCQFEALRQLHQPKEVKQALHALPKGLDATYDRMLESITPENQKQVARTLEWLCFSLRPLLLEEIAEAFILDPDAEVPFDDDNRLMPAGAVLGLLRGLVTEIPRYIHRYDRYHHASRDQHVIEIRLAHFSIKEYLVSDRMPSSIARTFTIKETDAHIHITESCVAYHLQLSKTTLATEELLRQYHLWEYILKYWTKHLDSIPSDKCTQSIKQGALQVFTRGSQALLNMARIRDPDDTDHDPNRETAVEELAPPLYHACSIDALRLTELVLEEDKDSVIDEISPQSEYGFALQAAADKGGEAIVQLLLNKGADVNVQGGCFGDALQAAAFRGRESIMQLLLSRGADVHTQGGAYGNALQAAAFRGRESIMQLLLSRGADVHTQGGAYGNALQAAAFQGHDAIVQLLLNRGADVHTQGGAFGNALQAAASRGHDAIVQLLLDRGADVNAQGGHFGNALQAATWAVNEAIVHLLLDKGADINAKGGEFGNALQAAVCQSWWEIGELLLLRGAEVDPPGPEWEELLAKLERGWGARKANRLRKLQGNPTVEGLRQMKKEDEEERERKRKEREERRRKNEEKRRAKGTRARTFRSCSGIDIQKEK